jgi:two-component system sensor histidine kinase UhpB
VSPDGRFLRINQKFCDIVGYTRDELLQLTFQHITHPDDLETDLALVDRLLEGRQDSYTLEKRYYRKDGEIVWINLTVGIVRDDGGEPKYFVSAVEDITPRKNVEAQLDEYQTRLKELASRQTIAEEKERRRIAALLHDNIGQSIALARIRLAAMRELVTDAGLASAMDDVSESLLRTTRDTRELIYDLSLPSMNEIGLAAAISEWLEERIGEQYNIETKLVDNTEGGPEVQLSDDVKAIVFRNVRELLTNVIKHANASNVTVTIETAGDNLKVSVEDDGIGFDPDRSSRETNLEGGFGLFSVRERMTNLDGSLEIVSGQGSGSRVVLTVPTVSDRS